MCVHVVGSEMVISGGQGWDHTPEEGRAWITHRKRAGHGPHTGRGLIKLSAEWSRRQL